MKIKWRQAAWFPVRYAFCPNEMLFQKEMVRSGYLNNPYPDTHACVVKYDDFRGDRCCLMTIHDDMFDGSEAVLIGLIVHESVHIVEAVIQKMQDEAPSEEFRAFATQAIFSELLTDIGAYRDIRKKRK